MVAVRKCKECAEEIPSSRQQTAVFCSNTCRSKHRNKKNYARDRDRRKAAALKWVEENKDRADKNQRCYRERNRKLLAEKARNWYSDNTEKAKQTRKAWVSKNRGKARKINAKRRSAKLRASPKWLSKEHLADIEKVYLYARLLEVVTECPQEVDHIVPLQGKNVCGLHVPWNLQVLPSLDNRRKGNSHHES